MTKNRLLLDTNILLTGFFVPQSKSFQVIQSVLRQELTGCVIENTIEEAENAISRAATQTGVNLIGSFRETLETLRRSGLIVLPRISRDEGRGFTSIKGAGDKALAAAAVKYSADICTNDIADFKKSDVYGFKVYTPEDLTRGGTIGLHTLCPGFLVTPNQGSFYIEFGALNWVNVTFSSDSHETLYLFDSEQIGACYFEAHSHSFVFQPDNGPRLFLYHGPVRLDSIKMVVSYDCNSGATIFLGTGTNSSQTSQWQSFPLAASARTYVGCDRHGLNQLSGCIKSIYGVPYPVNERAARNMINGVTVQNPWERLSLETMIRLLFGGG